MSVKPSLPRILAVDDRAENLLAYQALLKNVQCELITCTSGQDALKYLNQHDVALILLDVQMPVMDGFEAARRIRDFPPHAITPILFVTAIDHDRQHMLKAARLKIADVIYKPIEVEVFLAKIQIFLDLYEAKQFKRIKNQTHFIDAPGEVSRLYREKDWSKTSLGPIESWHLSLKTMIGVMLNSKFPKYITWGPDRIFLYNDAYTPLMADKHPHGLGKAFPLVWPEVWHQVEPMMLAVESGKSFYYEDLPMELFRNGKVENGYFTFSFSPIRDDSEEIGGLLCTCIETTAQKKTQEQIYRSERTLDQIFSESPSFMSFLRAPDFVFEKANNEFYKLIGHSDVIGKKVLEVLPEVETQEFIDLLKKVIVEKKAYFGNEIPARFNQKDGSFKDVVLDFVYQPLINSVGEVDGVICQGYDVTEKVMARKQVEESEALLKLVTDSIPDFISYIDGNECYQFVNPAYENWFRLKPEDILGKKVEEVLGDSYKFSKSYIAQALAGQNISFETKLQDKRGEIKKVTVSYIPNFNRRREVMGLVVVGHDVTAIREATDRLAKIQSISSNLTKALTIKEISKIVIDEGVPSIDANAGLISLLDPTDQYLNLVHATNHSSDMIESYQNIPLDADFPICEALKKDHPVIVQPHEKLRKLFPDMPLHEELMKGKAFVSFPIKIRDRKLGVLGLTFYREQVIDKNVLNMIQTLSELAGQAIDRAEVYEMEKAARLSAELAKDEAERANVLKSAFLANMSHEIRTPLGAMIGFADLLRDSRLSAAEHSSYIDILVRNGEQLSIIINDILDLSKVEAGHLTLEYVETHPDLIATEVISLLKVKAKEKKLELTYTMEASTPDCIISDPTRVRQILLNLVGNAIKFTQSGGVYVKSHGFKSDTGASCMTFEITDTGIGIPLEQVEKVFEMFVQADGSMTRRFGGTGLGLALSRRLARALGGDIKVKETHLSKGSTFTVTIEDHPERKDLVPLKRPTIIETGEPIKPDALKNVRVLVVDDAPDNQFLIRNFLSKRGATVESAENGLDGYQKALTGRYDVVLMDIQMPVMDGYMATQKLRDHGYKKPIIALTAHAMNEVAKKCLNVGCNDHLAKPIDSQELIRTIARHSLQN